MTSTMGNSFTTVTFIPARSVGGGKWVLHHIDRTAGDTTTAADPAGDVMTGRLDVAAQGQGQSKHPLPSREHEKIFYGGLEGTPTTTGTGLGYNTAQDHR